MLDHLDEFPEFNFIAGVSIVLFEPFFDSGFPWSASSLDILLDLFN